MTTVQDIYRFIDQVAPFAIQESWDNAGMLVGHWKRPVQKILVTLDITPEVVYDYIRSVSYPNNKAKHLVGMAQMLMKKFNGEVPSNLEELTQLPGVGRKTANVIQAVIFKKAALAVDTHVFRVSHRLGLVPKRCTTPYSVEMELKKHIPENLVAASHYWLLLHGRYTCTSRNPHCDKCALAYLCKSEDKREAL